MKEEKYISSAHRQTIALDRLVITAGVECLSRRITDKTFHETAVSLDLENGLLTWQIPYANLSITSARDKLNL